MGYPNDMPTFATEAEVYEHLGKLLQDVVADEQLGAPFARANTTVQYQLRAPDAQLTVRAVDGEERRVDLGQTDLRPEVVLRMDADVAHRFWLGMVNPAVALARGEITPRGPAAKVLELVPIGEPVFARYRDQLEAAGRDDLARG
jgi:putative sterol carrier protein